MSAVVVEAATAFLFGGRLVAPAGTLDGGELTITAETTKNERYPRLTLDGLGGALAVWQRDNGGDDANDLYGQRLGTDGQRLGPGFVVLKREGKLDELGMDSNRIAYSPGVHGSYML